MAGRTPNERLAAHIAEAGISNAGLAHRVTELAERKNLGAPRFNHSSVARWLAGEQPRGHTPGLLAEVFTGILGRKVSPGDIGMTTRSTADPGLEYKSDLEAAIGAATDLYGTDVHRRSMLTRTAFTAVAFVVPALRWMTGPAIHLTDRPGGRQVGETNVAGIRDLTATFRRLDNQFGGGHARTSVVQYLADEVTPLLKHGAYTAKVGAQLFSAAAEMTLLAGWMAFDLEQHAIAQRYLIQALSLAKAASDEALGGEVLAAMASQAAYLGDGPDTVDMARAAARSARRAGSQTLLSEALAAEAHGHALSQDPRMSAAVLGQSHAALDRARPGAEPSWLGYFDAAYLHARTGRVLLDCGDPSGGAAAMRESLEMKDGYERGQVFNLAVLAGSLIEAGQVDEGCAVGQRAVAASASMRSARVMRELGQLRSRAALLDAAPARDLVDAIS